MKIKISICTVEHFLIYMWSHAVFLSSLHAPMMRLIGALKTQSLVGPDIMSDTLLLEEDWSAPPSILETAGVLIILIMVSISLTAREMFPFLHQTFSEVRYEKEDSFKLFWQRDTLSTNWIRSGINILSYLPFLGRILGCTVLAISSWKVGLQKPKMWSLGHKWACLPKRYIQVMGWPGCWPVCLLSLNWAAHEPCAPALCRWWQEMLISRGSNPHWASMRHTGRATLGDMPKRRWWYWKLRGSSSFLTDTEKWRSQWWTYLVWQRQESPHVMQILKSSSLKFYCLSIFHLLVIVSEFFRIMPFFLPSPKTEIFSLWSALTV